MVDFANHRRFTLRCLTEDLVPVSIHLKQNIKTPKGLQIIRKAERALLNERVRSINNTLNMLKSLRDTCIEELGRVFSEDWMARCKDFIEVGREKHHLKTLRRQTDKFKRLLYKKQEKEGECTRMHGIHIGLYSNTTRQNNTSCIHVESEENCPLNNNRDQDERKERKENTWVKNLSSSTLTKNQIKALAHRPNYATVPRSPPVGEYITAIARMHATNFNKAMQKS